MEIDPDIRLYTRLAIGRGWSGGLNALLWLGGLGAFSLLRVVSDSARLRPHGHPTLEAAALLALMVAPARPIAQLLDLERRGVLDQTRMCGRPPHHVLFAFLAGSMWPWLLLAALLFTVDAVRYHSGIGIVRFGAIAFVVMLDVGLIAFATSPARVRDGWVVTSAFVVLAFGFYSGLMALEAFEWLSPDVFDRRQQMVLLAACAALPAATWLVLRTLKRPPAARHRAVLPQYASAFARFVPRAGPPELMRRLRSAVGTVGTPTLLLQLLMAAVAIGGAIYGGIYAAELYAGPINVVPWAGLPVVAIAASMTVRQEIESRTMELVRLTPQSPTAIALGWYAGLSLPFWMMCLLSAMTLRLTAPDIAEFSWWLPAFALLLPAVCLMEGFDHRLPGTYLAMFFLVSGLIFWPFIRMQEFRNRMSVGGLATNLSPWGLDLDLLLPVFATVVALGAACGRVVRPHGPALVSGAAAAAMAAVAIGLRIVPTVAYPRAVVGVLPFFAVLLAEERAALSAPWRRLAIGAGAAFVAVAAASAEAGLPTQDAIVTATCAALAVAIGLLSHELWHRSPVVPIAIAVATLLLVIRLPWQVVGSRASFRQTAIPYVVQLQVPYFLELPDVAILAVICAALVIAHRYARDGAALHSQD